MENIVERVIIGIFVAVLISLAWLPIQQSFLRLYWHGDQEFLIYDLETNIITPIIRYRINQPPVDGSTYFIANESKYFGFVEEVRGPVAWDFTFFFCSIGEPVKR
ncbi:MAG: hypothetical protein ACFFBD_28535 [Candidatus Hodarchaeota archaeon]